jgi:Spy/CpxP family protein refolding chaperone
MAILDAEKFVVLTPEQYPVFVQKLKRVQDARKQLSQRRNRAMNELRGLVNPNPATGKTVDEAAIQAKLKELDTVENDGHDAIEKALDELDQLLSPLQQARFRILEDNTERKKIDFLTKVRR